MEHCGLRPPSGNITIFGILLLYILLPIFVTLCTFLYFNDYRILSLTRTSLPDEKRRNKCRHEEETITDDETDEEDIASNPSTCSTDLLDGLIEDIQIPLLRPEVMSPTLGENVPPKLDSLLDAVTESVRTAAPGEKCPTSVTKLQHLPNGASQKQNSDSENNINTTTVVWDGKISWALKGASIFDNIDEEYSAFGNKSNILAHKPFVDLWIFHYGIRYIPSGLDSNVYRTIRIDELPREITIDEVLPFIGGEIYEARLANTTAMTGFNTAIITFVTEEDAIEFLASPKSKKLPGKVVPINTPTYPMSADTETLIKESGYTRCLGVFQDRQSLKREITHFLTRAQHNFSPRIESISDGPALGEVAIKMLSVQAAAMVFDLLNVHPALRRCQFRFLTKDAVPTEPTAGLFANGGSW
ncbi:hypothetical protein BJX63DRAFT_438395 [Aspergillus granulosus]|uniref:Uncharacterized protein n=1 Tax=Aspergillus granulosus TaxID=176169 RepID=A0ABR4GSM3_9EURO